MKTLTLALLALTTFTASASELSLPHFNWRLDDVKDRGLTKEQLFSEMDREHIKLGQSICANRALMWLSDIKKAHDINGAKIFLFYTNKTGKVGSKRWWYHVAPLINEGGEEFVLDAGFPGKFNGPLKTSAWLTNFAGSDKCYEIKPEDRDLLEHINTASSFPTTTRVGSYDCYTVKAPAGFWFPATVVNNMLGNAETAMDIDQGDVYEACKEATTTAIGRFLGQGKKKCKKRAGLED